MVDNINFREVNDDFLNKLDDDLQKIKSLSNIFMFAGKTRNIYECKPKGYERNLKDNIMTKSYKHGDESIVEDINNNLKKITNELSIGDHVETMATREAFITVKDHKDNFEQNPKHRLINPAKSELGRASKVILDETNDKIRTTTGFNQWKNTQSVIEWFNEITNKCNCGLLSFNITEFYPSINGGIPWIKYNNRTLFDVSMGSFDGAEICELVGLFIFSKLTDEFGKKSVGLYRDEGLMLLRGTSGRSRDPSKKTPTSLVRSS